MLPYFRDTVIVLNVILLSWQYLGNLKWFFFGQRPMIYFFLSVAPMSWLLLILFILHGFIIWFKRFLFHLMCKLIHCGIFKLGLTEYQNCCLRIHFYFTCFFKVFSLLPSFINNHLHTYEWPNPTLFFHSSTLVAEIDTLLHHGLSGHNCSTQADQCNQSCCSVHPPWSCLLIPKDWILFLRPAACKLLIMMCGLNKLKVTDVL